MSVTINGSSGLTFNDASTQNTAATGFGFKNRIINGAMMIDQRNAGASVTPTDGQYCLDRWKAGASAASKFSVQQSTTAPAGFGFSMLCTSLSAYSVGTNDNFEMYQPIEGFNTADLAWGTASAQSVTLSFWVRSSLTGTFGGSLLNSAFNYSYPFTYTISAANTWEQKSVTVSGPTAGTWIGATNGIGVVVNFGLGAGSGRSGTAGSWASATYYNATGATSVVGTNGATFYITGVQLEVGSTATSFDYRPYGTELALCQRYCETITSSGSNNGWWGGYMSTTTNMRSTVPFRVTKRAAPSITFPTPSSSYIVQSIGSNYTPNSFTAAATGTNTMLVDVGITSAATQGYGANFLDTSTATLVIISAEL